LLTSEEDHDPDSLSILLLPRPPGAQAPYPDSLLEELVTLVADTFPWTLQDVHGFPERTSDRKH
jgi:hypothetical protein